MKLKWMAIFFTIFIFAIIILADLGFLRTPLQIMNDIPYGDKLGHFFLIGILAFLVIASLIQSLPSYNSKLVAFSAAFLLAAIFSIEEASQVLVRGRDASWKDLFMNYAGIVFFGSIAWLLNRKRKP